MASAVQKIEVHLTGDAEVFKEFDRRRTRIEESLHMLEIWFGDHKADCAGVAVVNALASALGEYNE